MNKELYIKREEQLKKLRELSFLVHTLEKFLEKNEKNFKKEESIEALKRIKEYFKLKEDEYCECDKEYWELYDQLRFTCKHEVAIRYFNSSYYQCLICGNNLDYCDKLPEKALISIDTADDYKVADIIEDIFKEVVHSDKDLMETISEAIEEMQYEKNIKVYRR